MIINFKYLGQGGGSSSGGGMTSGDVETLIESYNYVNSGQVETQITGKGYVTSADFEEATEVISEALNDLNERATPVTITTAITSGSTDEEVPSAKAVYEELGGIETLLSQI